MCFAHDYFIKFRNKKGFSLLEVIISIFIVGLVVVLFQLSLNKMGLIRYAKNQDIALRVANNKIEELRALGYASLPASGSFSDSQLDQLEDETASIAVTDYNSDIKQVTIDISWTELGSTGTKNITLTTLIAKTGGL